MSVSFFLSDAPTPVQDGHGNTRLIPENPDRLDDVKDNCTGLMPHCDYLRFRSSLSDCDRLHQLLDFVVGRDAWVIEYGSPWTAGAGANNYPHRVRSVSGVHGGFLVDEETGSVEIMVDLPGSYWEPLSVRDQWRLCRGLVQAYQAKATRFDIAIDDASYSLIPVDQMFNAWKQGNGFGFINCQKIGGGKTVEEWEETTYFGSRNSGKMVRIYNHKDKFHRFETEFKRGYADQVFQTFSSSDYSHDSLEEELHPCSDELHPCSDEFDLTLSKLLASIAVGAIDFRDKSVRKDRSKASFKDTPRLDFYQVFIDLCGTHLRVKLRQVEKCLRKTIAWMQRQTSATIAMVRQGLGSLEFMNWMRSMTDKGSEKFNGWHKLMIDFIRTSPDSVRLEGGLSA